jgi:hydroxypyruvate isomerase
MINGTDMPRFLVQNIAQAQEMLEAVNHPALKMQYDCYHMAMMGEDVLEGYKKIFTRLDIFNLQIVRDAMNLIQLKFRMSKFFHG